MQSSSEERRIRAFQNDVFIVFCLAALYLFVPNDPSSLRVFLCLFFSIFNVLTNIGKFCIKKDHIMNMSSDDWQVSVAYYMMAIVWDLCIMWFLVYGSFTMADEKVGVTVSYLGYLMTFLSSTIRVVLGTMHRFVFGRFAHIDEIIPESEEIV
jgi:hypothetical protein